LEIEILEGVQSMDFEKVTQMLAKAYWSEGIKIDEVRQGAVHSALVVGAFCSGAQVGFARVISDYTRFAYLSDVYVDEEFRNNGIARKMLDYILSHETLKDVYHWTLKTTVHKLYEKMGFGGLAEPERWMEIRKPVGRQREG
jgi:GNAT superfamily N-acetyltransferase